MFTAQRIKGPCSYHRRTEYYKSCFRIVNPPGCGYCLGISESPETGKNIYQFRNDTLSNKTFLILSLLLPLFSFPLFLIAQFIPGEEWRRLKIRPSGMSLKFNCLENSSLWPKLRCLQTRVFPPPISDFFPTLFLPCSLICWDSMVGLHSHVSLAYGLACKSYLNRRNFMR